MITVPPSSSLKEGLGTGRPVLLLRIFSTQAANQPFVKIHAHVTVTGMGDAAPAHTLPFPRVFPCVSTYGVSTHVHLSFSGPTPDMEGAQSTGQTPQLGFRESPLTVSTTCTEAAQK